MNTGLRAWKTALASIARSSPPSAERCGKDFVIGVRINGQEFGHPNAITPAEAAEAGKLLEAAGVDYISVTGYGYGQDPDAIRGRFTGPTRSRTTS